jgi:hypothetical protein
MIFVIPPFKKDIIPGSEWIMIGIQLFIAAIFFFIGFMNRRESYLTRILLVIVGIGIILWGIIGLFIPAVESEQTLVWKTATRICAIDEIAIGIIAIYSCI